MLFAVYIDGLLDRLKESGIGCNMGNSYVGYMVYADNIKLLCPSLNGMQQMVDMCVDYADEYNINVNGSKSHMLLFKGRQCKDSQRTLIIDEVTIHCSESVSNLGHNVSTNDKDSIAKSAKTSFWRRFNPFRCDLGHIYSFIKCKLFQQYCCSFLWCNTVVIK